MFSWENPKCNGKSLNSNLKFFFYLNHIFIRSQRPCWKFFSLLTRCFFWESTCSFLIDFDGFLCSEPIRSIVRHSLEQCLESARKVFLCRAFQKFYDLLFGIDVDDINLFSASFMLSARFSRNKLRWGSIWTNSTIAMRQYQYRKGFSCFHERQTLSFFKWFAEVTTAGLEPKNI